MKPTTGCTCAKRQKQRADIVGKSRRGEERKREVGSEIDGEVERGVEGKRKIWEKEREGGRERAGRGRERGTVTWERGRCKGD